MAFVRRCVRIPCTWPSDDCVRQSAAPGLPRGKVADAGVRRVLWWRASSRLRPALSLPQLAESLLAVLCRVLIFANRIKTVRFVHGELHAGGWRAVQLHGERSQEEREVSRRLSPADDQRRDACNGFADR